jgi:signal transduction histidine kinase
VVAQRSGRRILGLAGTDVLLAAVLLVASVGGVVAGQVDEGPPWVTVPVAVAGCAAVAIRARYPLAAAVVVAVSGAAQTVLGDHSPSTLMSLAVTLLVAFAVAAEADETAAVGGLVALLASQLGQEWLDGGTDYAFVVLEVGGAWLLGRGARQWRVRARYAEQHQRDLAHLAVAEERGRIARELHDVVAHSLSVIAVQADAAEAALDRDPARAGPPLRAIRDSAREALVDMRQLLHLLHDDAAADGGAGRDGAADVPGTGDARAADRSPSRGLADLPALVTSIEATGVPVDARIEVGAPVPAAVELAVYRIVQEALTNVRRHAGCAATRVRVRTVDGSVQVEVSNEAGVGERGLGQWSTGHGLVGARERARVAGGTLRAGPRTDGGYDVLAVLPLDGRRR